MSIFHIPLTSLLAWLLAMALTGAGLSNGLRGKAVQDEFVRWGYPAWWNFVTAAMEIFSAALIFFATTRIWGLAFAELVLVSALGTLILRREYKHLPPAVGFTVVIAIEFALVLSHA